MRLLENVMLALAGLRASKMRSLLTMLGIIIGIGSVIAITTIGDAMTRTLTETMASFGVNNIEMDIVMRESGYYSNVPETDRITDDMIYGLFDALPEEVLAVSVTHTFGAGKAQDGRLYANVHVQGVTDGTQIADNIELVEGRFISRRDVLGSKNVAVVSDKLAGKLFPGGKTPLEQELKVSVGGQIYTFTIVGVYQYKSMGFGGFSGPEEDLRTGLYIPVSTAKKLSGAEKGYTYFMVTTAPGTDPMVMKPKLEAYFERFYKNNPKYTVVGFSMGSMLEQATTMLSTVKLAIAAIAAISLLVGGIGVMNIMLVSVTERTREIGTRKALGARSSAIRSQFVVESMIICMIGGFIGVLLGLGLGAVGSSLLGSQASANVPTIIIAVLFSMFIGVFFGYYPANKAAKMDPIEALRYE